MVIICHNAIPVIAIEIVALLWTGWSGMTISISWPPCRIFPLGGGLSHMVFVRENPSMDNLPGTRLGGYHLFFQWLPAFLSDLRQDLLAFCYVADLWHSSANSTSVERINFPTAKRTTEFARAYDERPTGRGFRGTPGTMNLEIVYKFCRTFATWSVFLLILCVMTCAWRKFGDIYVLIPSGKLSPNYGKSPCY